jgi:sec-independent protein translocase protein TatA
MPDISPLHLLILLAILLLLFGAAKLPGLGKSMGQSIRGFKSGLKGDDEEKDEEKPSAPPPAGDDDSSTKA